MIKRTVDISEQAFLHVEHKQLCVDKEGKTISRIAIEDLGILILQHPAIVTTQTVMVECQKNNVAILFCDERHLPLSILLPLWDGHSLHTKVLREQLSASEPTRKRLWQQIVRRKIQEQAVTLEHAGQSAKSLYRLRDKVKSGDLQNCEAQAARQYWTLLMGNNFRRHDEGDAVNSLLNYGYAIVRAMVARALVGTGLHPALGLHHKNQYNGLCLADDIMEPFRPWVDWLVYRWVKNGGNPIICKETKQLLLGIAGNNVILENREMPLMIAVHSVAARLKQALSDREGLVIYPERIGL